MPVSTQTNAWANKPCKADVVSLADIIKSQESSSSLPSDASNARLASSLRWGRGQSQRARKQALRQAKTNSNKQYPSNISLEPSDPWEAPAAHSAPARYAPDPEPEPEADPEPNLEPTNPWAQTVRTAPAMDEIFREERRVAEEQANAAARAREQARAREAKRVADKEAKLAAAAVTEAAGQVKIRLDGSHTSVTSSWSSQKSSSISSTQQQDGAIPEAEYSDLKLKLADVAAVRIVQPKTKHTPIQRFPSQCSDGSWTEVADEECEQDKADWLRVEAMGGEIGVFVPKTGWIPVGADAAGDWTLVGTSNAHVQANSKQEKDLFEACERGDVAWMQRLLDAKVDAECLCCEDGAAWHELLPVGIAFEKVSPIVSAARSGHSAAIKVLVEQANVDASGENLQLSLSDVLSTATAVKTPTGATALVAACSGDVESRVLEVVEYLVGGEPRLSAAEADGHGYTAMWVAASNGFLSVVKQLYEYEGERVLRSGDPLGGTPLMAAAAHGHLDVVKYLVEEAKAPMDVTDNFGQTAAMTAADLGQQEVVDFFCEKGFGHEPTSSCALM